VNCAKKTALTAALLVSLTIKAQSPPGATPKFEVASIKPIPGLHPPPDAFELGLMKPRAQNGRFTMSNAPLSLLIQFAYNVKDTEFQGGPAWINSDRYEVVAKAEGDATLEQMRPMVQALLADRFKLALRRESKEVLVYELSVARGGPKIAASKEGSCVTPDPNNPPPRRDPNHPAPPINFCGGVRRALLSVAPERKDRLEGFSIPMAKLIELISDDVHRTVVDKTGFTEKFDLHLEFAPSDAMINPAAEQPGVSMFTALREQLGLRLEAAKRPVEVLAIDHVEKPSEN
jgi:uncharacterized protein (TIGR03435 family)